MASKKDVEQAWENAREVRGRNPDTWRRDPYGNLIRHGSYGTQGEFGWELDHKFPESKGGSDTPHNIQAVQWEQNREKGDKYPYRKG